MKLVAEQTLSSRKEDIRRKWAKSDKASSMRVLEFGQFLLDLDKIKTHKELEELEARWMSTTGQ
jgi:hypothetical protein